MGRRSKSNNAISLFPFLAVLVCTMGALILLLIAMTKKIQQAAVAKARAAAVQLATSEVEPEPEPVPEPELIYLPDAPSRQIVGPTEAERAALAEKLLVEREAAARQRAQREAEIAAERERLRRAWAGRVAEAEAERDRLRKAVAASRDELKQLNAGVDSALRDDQRARAALAELQRQQDELAAREKGLAAADKELALELEKVKQRIDTTKRKQAGAPSPYALVPYDGASGTVRHPIYIECTDVGLKFLPEGEIITAKDLEGFTEGFNPLLAGSVALMKYWNEKRMRSNTDEPEPYILLLVRPSGSVAYYIARKLLTRLDVPFGYELIEEDWALDTPPPDPEAAKIVRTAVTEVVNTRDNLMDALAGRGGGTGRGPGGAGRGPGGGLAGGSLIGEEPPELDFPGGATARSPVRPIPSGLPGGSEPGTGRGPRPLPISGDRSGRNESDLVASASRGGSGMEEFPGRGERSRSRSEGMGNGGVATGPARLNGGRGDGFEAPAEGMEPSSRSRSRAAAPVGPLPEQLESLPMTEEDNWRKNLAPGREPGGPFEGLSGSVTGNLRSEEGMQRTRAGGLGGGRDPLLEPGAESTGTSSAGVRGQATTKGQAGQPTPGQPSPGENTFSSTFGPSDEERGPEVGGAAGSGKAASEGGTSRGPKGTASSPGGASAGGSSLPTPGGSPAIGGGARGSRGDSGADRMTKRWGYSHGRSNIGLEKKLEIHVLPNRILIGPNDSSVACGQGESKEELVNEVLRGIEGVTFSWGKPPRNFYWIPVIKFVVYPGGNQHYERLQNGLREWGLFSTVEFTVREPPKNSLSGALK